MKRYRFGTYAVESLAEDPDGEWVRLEDCKKLAAKTYGEGFDHGKHCSLQDSQRRLEWLLEELIPEMRGMLTPECREQLIKEAMEQ